jgi:peptide subunit release factor 1 (eRF1)
MRPARQFFSNEAKTLLDAYSRNSPAAQGLETDIERVERYLANERIDRHVSETPLPSEAQGIVIVARASDDLFVGIPLGVPVENQVTAGPIPSLMGLVRESEDHSAYAVLLADQQSASLFFVSQRRAFQEIQAQGASYPFRRNAGGSQRRYQARAGERLDQFARAIAEGVRQELEGSDIGVLILVGDEVITSPLNRFLHDSVSDRIIASIRGQITSTPSEIVDLTTPYAVAAEREREQSLVSRIQDQLGQNNLATSGTEAVLRALQNRQVDHLALLDDFSQMGWADYSARVVGVGPVPDHHPTGGNRSSLVPIAIEDELVRRALNSGAAIEIVHSSVAGDTAALTPDEPAPARTHVAQTMDALGGVAALLRYV